MKQSPESRKSNQIVSDKVAMILMTEIADPRLSMVTVTGAAVSRDRSVCNIYISAEADRYDEVRSGLESAKGRIRSILGRSLGWRVTPELRFHIDTTIDEAERIAVALQNVPAYIDIPKDEDGQPLPLDEDGNPIIAEDGDE